jgi:hypothetical protein
MRALVPSLDDSPAPPGVRVAILERNRAVGQRLARVLACASGFADVVHEEEPAALRSALAPDPLLLACDASDIDLALEWASSRYPSLRILTWTTGPTDHLVDLASSHPRIHSIIGWPQFASAPRLWEVAMATRRILDPGAAPPRLADFIRWGGSVYKWRPRTSHERDHVVGEIQRVALAAGASSRVAERLSEVAHEMLMNAMYDAPIDATGAPRFAHDRRQEVELHEQEAPTLRMAVDGAYIGLQVHDPFGRLQRRSVLGSVSRGLGASQSGREARQVLDTSSGGAGLGMFKIYSASAVMMVDVEPGESTTVTALVDLDVSPRELRSMPVSLHIFDHG